MTQFVVKRLKTGQNIVKFEPKGEPENVSAWFEPCEHRRGYIDFKVNGISTFNTDETDIEMDDFASKWMQAFGKDAEVDKHGRVSYVSSSTRSILYKKAMALLEEMHPEYLSDTKQVVGCFDTFVNRMEALNS